VSSGKRSSTIAIATTMPATISNPAQGFLAAHGFFAAHGRPAVAVREGIFQLQQHVATRRLDFTPRQA